MIERTNTEPEMMLSRRKRGIFSVLAGTLLATVVVVAPVATPIASAAGNVTLIDKSVVPATTLAAPALPGAVFDYTISYDCSGLGAADNCTGALITDTLPTFTDIYGNLSQLEFVSAVATTPSDWLFQGVSGSAPTQQVSWLGTSNLVSGDTGAVVLQLRVPLGVVPFTPTAQQVSNTANVSLAGQADDQAGPAISYINAQPAASSLAKSGPSTALLNAAGTDNISHTISLCAQPARPLWQNYTVTDTLPPGVTVVEPLPFGGVFTPGTPSTSVPGPLPGDPPVVTPGTGGTIVWNLTAVNRPPVTAQGCLQLTFQVNYQNAFAGGDLTNVIGNTKTNSVSAVGSNSSGGSQNIGPATTTLTLIGPVTRFGPSKNANGNYYVQDLDTVIYNLGASNTSDAEAVPFSTATLADGPFPAGYTLTSINTGTWTGAVATVTASIETSPNGSTWTQVATAPSTTVPVAPGVQYVRWVFTSVGAPAIGPGWAATGQRLTGTITGSPPPSVVLTNCVRLTGVQSDITQDRGQRCANVELETPQPHPSITKTAPSTIEPGQTVTYSLVASNDGDSTGVLVNPQLADCVPASEFLVVSNLRAGGLALPANGWSVEAGPTPGSCTPTSPAAVNSGTFIQLQYSGTLNPGEAAPTITYDLTADAYQTPTITDTPALPGRYTNTVTITNGDGSPFAHCVQPACRASATITVPVIAELQSNKQVLGAVDVAFNKAGTTTPGGQVIWKIEVRNLGNVETESVQFVDVFGYIGDVGVRRTDQKRGSEFVPYLTSVISTTPGWTVEYSMSSNPCRPEVLGPNTGCDAPNWTATPDLLDLPQYRSIRLTYSGRILIGETLSFQYEMVTPVFDPTYDTPNTTASPYDQLTNCTIPDSTPPYNPALPVPNTSGPGNSTLSGSRTEVAAWLDDGAGGGVAGDGIQQPGEGGPTCPRSSNSFAYGVSVPTDQLGGLPNPGRLGAEPPKVDLFVAAPPQANVIGDRVWEDFNNNGLQDSVVTEPGIPFVRVELYDSLGNFVDSVFTDLNGNYLFEELPDGSYTVRFYMPDDRGYISPQDSSGVTPDAGAANTNNDSDIPQTPTGNALGGNYYDTVAVTLGPLETDPTWDAGIWLPKPTIDVKKYVNGNDAQTTPGVNIPRGAPVTWTYDITNTGNTFLKGVALSDLVTISGQANPVPVCNWAGSSDPLTPANVLSRGETVSCTAAGTAIAGQYGNNATVVGTPTLDDGTTAITGKVNAAGTPLPTTVSDSDPAHYFGVEYDLALAKVTNVGSVVQGGSVTFTIRVVNQGNVPSLAYTVTDTVPNGLTVVGTPSTVPAATSSSSSGRVYSWVMPSLAPGATADITIVTTVADINQRPFRNWAEISVDSSGTYGTTDFDSTPNTNTGDDSGVGLGSTPDDQFIDNLSLANIPDTVPNDEDDNDLALVAGTVTYDLALVKTVSPTPLIGADGLATWTITIKNQGNVDSRPYTVTDNVPGGLQVLSTLPSATSSAGRTLTWVMPNLAPGATATITINTEVTDLSRKPFVNWAEISTDGSGFYSIAGDTITDIDSTPDAFLGDDPNAGTGTGPTNAVGTPELNIDRLNGNDVNTDIANDEDDSDQAAVGSDTLYDLALVKTVAAPTVAPDGVITWTITVLNQGNVPSRAYTVTDTIPTGLAVAAGTTPPTSNAGQVYNWVMPSLAAGATATITITTTITDINRRPFRNWAEISSDSAATYGTVDADSVPDSNTGADTGAGTSFGSQPNDVVIDQTVVPVGQYNDPFVDEDDNDLAQVDVPVEYDLALIKTASTAVVGQDGTIIWTITVANQGNVDSGQFVVRDVLPGGVTFQSAIPDPSSNPVPGVYTWTVASIAPGATRTIVITTTASDLKLRPFRNWAEISSDSASSYNVPGTVVTDADSTPDSNTGSDAGAGVGTAPNDAVQNHNSLLFDAGTPSGFPGVDEDDNDFEEVTANPVYDLALAKVATTPTATVGVNPTWTIRVYNQGNVRSGPVQVRDDLPTGLTYAGGDVFTSSGPALIGASCNSLTVTCSIPNIEAGDFVDIVLTTTIAGNDLSTAPWRNWAEISSDSAQLLYGINDIDSTPDTNTGSDNTLPNDASSGGGYIGVDALGPLYVAPGPDEDDNDDAVITNTGVYDLALAKTANAAVINYDQTVTFTVTVRNQGTLPSGVYTIVDTVPDGLTPTAVGGGTYNSIDRTITWTMPNLAVGATITRTYTASIADINKRPFRNFAEISGDSAQTLYGIDDIDSVPDDDITNDGDYGTVGASNPIDNLNPNAIDQAGVGPDSPANGGEDDADIADVAVNVVYDLALVKVVDATDLATNGPDTGTATFTVTVANQGTVPSGTFTVTDWMPVGIEPTLPIANGGVWNSGARTITWAMPTMLPGAVTTRSFVVTISDITQRPYRNLAEISADSAATYNTTDIDSIPNLVKTDDGTYPAIISQPGDGIDNLLIADAGVRGGDPQDDADIADLTYPVIYDLALVKVNDAAVVQSDDTIDYTITVQNQGNVKSHDFVVTDTLPAGLDIVDAGGGTVSGNTISWTITNLDPGATTTLSFTLEIGDITLRPYRNFAEISADSADDYDARGLDGASLIDIEDIDSQPDATTDNDGAYPPLLEVPVAGTDSDNLLIGEAGVETADTPPLGRDDADIADVGVEVVYDLALAKVPSATTINPDGTVTFTITVENQGTVNSNDYTITDTLPAGTEATAASDGGVITASTVTWNLTDLAPGNTTTVTVTVTITDITLRPFKNIAEISADGADDYDVPARVDFATPIDVEDEDSVPDPTTTNDNGLVVGDGYGTYETPLLDLDDIADVDTLPNGEDDADVAFFDAPVVYDLALIKTGPASIDGAATATFTITIKNQGNVPSGDFTVVDEIPLGLLATDASDGGVIADPLVTWNLTGLAPGAVVTVTVTVRVVDFSTRPWVNVAEITSDSADDFDTDGYENPADGDVEDDDSVPDGDLDNDVLVDQDTLPTDQFNDPSVDEDDHDVAPITVDIDYDLALVKVLPANQSFKKGNPVVFNILVKNQGNVDSGPVTVQDVIPAGLLFVSATAGGLSVGQVVTWEIANLTPGQIVTLSVTVTVDNVTLASYINLAEIVADGSAAYSTDGDIVTDADSTPDTNIGNDPLVDTDEVNIDQIPGDEDDHDRALLDPAKVRSDNPRGGGIPATGSNTMPLLYGAAVVFGLGALALLITRRRRGQLA